MPKPMRTVLALAAVLPLTACGGASFSGNSGPARQAPKPDPAPIKEDIVQAQGPAAPGDAPATPSPEPQPGGDPPTDVVIPPDCGAAGATQARLLTQSVVNGAESAVIDYEIFRTDCNGKVLAITSDVILFDLDAAVDHDDLAFTVTGGTSTLHGQLVVVNGIDLFGHSGSEWSHYRTDQRVSVAPATKSLRLRLHLAGRYVEGREDAQNVPTYLRFGDAAPVTKIVRFTD